MTSSELLVVVHMALRGNGRGKREVPTAGVRISNRGSGSVMTSRFSDYTSSSASRSVLQFVQFHDFCPLPCDAPHNATVYPKLRSFRIPTFGCNGLRIHPDWGTKSHHGSKYCSFVSILVTRLHHPWFSILRGGYHPISRRGFWTRAKASE